MINYIESIEFLKDIFLEKLVLLTAIPLIENTRSKTFNLENEEDCRNWLEQNKESNLYYSVNPVIKPLRKKPSRRDIKSVNYLHVDIDPREGEDLVEEQERILNLLQNPPEGIPQPTVVVFSGGGYQALWKLQEPISIDGDLNKAEEAARYNLQLAHHLGGDHCQNIDRLLRLPGTINYPNAKKQDWGRVPIQAKLIEFNHSCIYPISVFTKASVVETTSDVQVNITGHAPLANLADLDQWNVPDRIKVIIKEGYHLHEETKSGKDSRSEWLFDVTCGLVRCHVPDNLIYGIITEASIQGSATFGQPTQLPHAFTESEIK